jgi:hypothetical protein
MTTYFAIWFGACALLVLVPRFRHRLTDAKLAAVVQVMRGVESEALVYRVATKEELEEAPAVTVVGMRGFGALATTFRGTKLVLRYVIDDSRTIVATRSRASLSVTSMAGKTLYSTVCLRIGLPQPTPDVDREWFPINAPDHKMVVAHRARIAKAAEPLLQLSTIEQLAELQTELSRRTAQWRATQDEHDLLEADLRSILRDRYARRGDAVRAKLGSLVPKARVVS